jgi:hypothetical protein
MLSAIIKYGKKILLLLITAAMVMTYFPNNRYSYADYSENEIRKVDVVVRAGEWGNNKQAKPGKRYEWGNDINISKHGISVKDIPKDIPLRRENNQWFISEFDINLKLARAIAKKLDSYGVDVNLQYATDKSGDLNAAGRKAAQCDPKIYLSVHHNSYRDDSTGYFFMYNQGDTKSAESAVKLSNSLKHNNKIPQRENRANDGYIGELNQVKNESRISILGEFGYFNKAEIVKICSDDYVNYVAEQIAREIANQLNDIEQSTIKVVSSNVEEVRVRFTDIDNKLTIENKVTSQTREVVTLRFK